MPSTSSGSLILPVVLWENTPPECQISSILINDSEKYIFTGTSSGHIIMWDFNLDEINPVCLMVGHTTAVNCLAKAGSTKDEEYIVSSSENGEMKLWEINEKKCIENIKMSNTIHKQIYSSRLGGKLTRLFCIGNYTDVLVIDPISLEILYTLVSRENHQWIKALCINSLANKQDDVIVGVSITGTIRLWTLNANEVKGSEILEHEFKDSLCENASTLASCPGKQRIFIIVCPKFFQIFDAVDFTVLCNVNIKSLINENLNDSASFTNGFFIDIENIIVCTSDGVAYQFSLPENINPQSSLFRKSSGLIGADKYFPTKLLFKFNTIEPEKTPSKKIKIKHFYNFPIFYLYELRKRASTTTTQQQQQQQQQQQTPPPPPPVLAQKYLIRGDSHGKISLWNLNQTSNENSRYSDYETSLQKFWVENVKQDDENFGRISTLLYLQPIDKIVYGMTDGSIVIVPAIEFLIHNLFRRHLKEKSNKIKLKKHTAKVTCILYPHSEHSRYDPTMLVTGSLDFSIILWNINTGEMMHKFVVQTGEILQLSVPPNTVNPRILQCICSIASDHSVALLSLKECKTVMVANRHLFPVLFVKWRPLDDFLIAKCSDGGVFVWQIETGTLERVAHGLQAEDILHAADEIANNPENYSPQNATGNLLIPSQIASNFAAQSQNNPAYTTPMIISNKSISNQTIALAHILHKRNFSHAIKVISQKLASTKEDSKKTQPVIDSTSINFPLVIQPFHLSINDPVKHLILFDIDALLTTLTLEEYSIDGNIKQIKTSFYRDVHNIQSAPVQVISPLYRTTPEVTQSVLKRNASAKQFDSIDIKQLNNLKKKLIYAKSIIKLTHILLSSLHIWSIDNDLDKEFSDTLNLEKPKYPISFGRISRGAHLFIMFPPKRPFENKISRMTHTFSVSSNLNQFSYQNLEAKIPKSFTLDSNESDEELSKLKPSSSESSATSSSATSKSNSSYSIPRGTSMQPLLEEHAETPSPTREYWLSSKIITTEQLLSILAIASSFMRLQNFIELEIKREDLDPMEFILNQNQNYEKQSVIRQAYSRLSTMYCMLADYNNSEQNDFVHKPLNLETLALKWMDPSYEIRESAQTLLKNELKRMGPNGRAALIKIWEAHLSSFLKDFDELSQSNVSQMAQSNISLSSSEQTSVRQSTSTYDLSHLAPTSNRIRRKQFVSIILLSLIGAEFGQDVNSNKNQTPYKTIPQGFSLEDHSILKRISTALSNLVTNKSLHYDITRRAAIDLIGRGFSIWEPFIQPNFIILTLLELSADAEIYSPRVSINLPLTSIADLCKIARSSLIIIANSKPKTFILTIAKEIKRINAPTSQVSQSGISFGPALTRGKQEILNIIERLIENQCQDVFELLSDAIEIILFCLDPNQIRSLGLEETFSALFKFPMVRYCKETKRIICGCHNGRLVVYEYKASKWNLQSYSAHNNQPIVAVAITTDSKYVASYSAHDNSLIFWQSSGGSIFNIGSNTLKQIKVCNAAPIELSVPYTKLANLFWQNRTLNLIYHDNRKFSYQI